MLNPKKVGEILDKDIKGGEKEIAKYDAKIKIAQEKIEEYKATIMEARAEIDTKLNELRELSTDKLKVQGMILAYEQLKNEGTE